MEPAQNMHRRGLARLTHPLFLGALTVLALNDHVLKALAWAPELSGKLSDVAGLLVAPLLLAWLLGVERREVFVACHVLVGAGFAALQSTVIANAINDLPAQHVWADPTDLWALPALLVSYAVFRKADRRHLRAHRPRAHRETSQALVGAIALVFCTATNAPGQGDTPPRYPFPPAGRLETDVYVRNHLASDLSLAVRPLRDEVTVDCDEMLADPDGVLHADDFGDEREWTAAARDAVPLWDRRGGAMTRECYAVRFRARDREWLIAWRHGEPALRDVPVRLEPHESAEAEAMRVSADPDTAPHVPSGVSVHAWPD